MCGRGKNTNRGNKCRTSIKTRRKAIKARKAIEKKGAQALYGYSVQPFIQSYEIHLKPIASSCILVHGPVKLWSLLLHVLVTLENS